MKKIYISLLALGLVGCADTDIKEYVVSKPESVAQYEYLANYGNLKDIVDRAAHPNFKVAAALAASDYNAQGVVYRVANTNFDEITLGNAMKYASCVNDKGEMDFSTVKTLLANASAAGMSVFGHTLAWHSQQNNTYLNSLIADKEMEIDPDAADTIEDGYINYGDYTSFPYYVMGYEPVFEDGMMRTSYPDSWYQYFAYDGLTTEAGKDYTITVYACASEEVAFTVNMGDWSVANSGTLKIGTEWAEYSVVIPGAGTTGFVVFQPGTATASIDYQWLRVTHQEAQAATYWVEQVKNGDIEGDDMSCFFATESTDGPHTAVVGPAGSGADGVGHAIVIECGANPTNEWDTQLFIQTDHVWQEGEKYKFTMKMKATEDRTADSQAHYSPGNYLYWSFVGSPTITTEWTEYVKQGSITADQAGCTTIAFNLSKQSTACTYWFDDISWCIEESGNTIPLTDEEKKEVLSEELQRWIYGMMEACDSQVKAWDVVNEAIAGTGNDEGFYTLQSASLSDDPTNNFYWQDYLGNVDYVRLAVKYAREAYEEYGGNADDLKLFINDYNLESDWDDCKKVKSLIHWVEKWEADGVTKIDGLATQMHVSYYENPTTQASKEAHVEQMLKLMAATGKLVKISELDMGYVDANGVELKTGELTLEQEKNMADYYQFIIEKYFEIVPASQQYAICQWCMTDSPEGSSWRAGCPVGLWDSSWSRKPAYAGWAEGLAK